MKSAPIYIALGGNLPFNSRPPEETLIAAMTELGEAGVRCVATSSNWHSPAWPDPSDPSYINAVAAVETDLGARALLDLLHTVETRYGRTREVRWASRTLDLDLLDYRGTRLSDEAGLQIPHPRAQDRAFVLLPLQEIAPDWRHPQSGTHIADLIAGLDAVDLDGMRKLQSSPKPAAQSLAFTGLGG